MPAAGAASSSWVRRSAASHVVEKASRPRRIQQVAKQLSAETRFQPKDGVFQCDEFCRAFVQSLNGDVPEELAKDSNHAYSELASSKAWQRFDVGSDAERAFGQAQLAANAGFLVLAIYGNPDSDAPGHMAVVVPSREAGGGRFASGKWGMQVPLVANAGSSVFDYKALSYAFTADKKDRLRIFVYLPTSTFSVVDYLDSLGRSSSFEDREKLYRAVSTDEEYKGSAKQNLRLLNHLLESEGTFRIPFPSSAIDRCESFYDDPEVSRLLTEAFRSNAKSACTVTGTAQPASAIREELQRLYTITQPKNGSVFTAAEHKEIHDKAYREAGCKEDAAWIGGWWIMNVSSWPDGWVKKSIEWFGPCTVDRE